MTRQGKGRSLPTAVRLIRMMQFIPRHSEGARGRIGAAQLHERLQAEGFSVSLRTVQRNLEDLHEIFPNLKNDGNRDMLGWYWAAPDELMDIPAMDAPLALAFKLAEQYLEPVAPSVNDVLEPYLRAAGRALDARARGWLDRVAIVPRSMPLIPARVDARTARLVQTALLERRRLRLRYHPRSGEVAEYELSPQGLVIRHEVSYLVATAWEYTDLRHYALHRIEPGSLEMLSTPATELEDFSLQRYIDQGAFQYRCSEKSLHLVLRLDRNVAQHLSETPLSEDQRIDPLEEAEDWVRLRATVADTLQLRWWLLGLGDQVVVEQPKALQMELSRTLEYAAANYST